LRLFSFGGYGLALAALALMTPTRTSEMGIPSSLTHGSDELPCLYAEFSMLLRLTYKILSKTPFLQEEKKR